jgi:hypothetical protein
MIYALPETQKPVHSTVDNSSTLPQDLQQQSHANLIASSIYETKTMALGHNIKKSCGWSSFL